MTSSTAPSSPPSSTLGANATRPHAAAARAASLVLLVAIGAALAVLVGGPGYRLGWWTFGTGIQVVRWGATVAIGTLLFALFTAGIGWMGGARRAVRVAVLALAVSLLAAVPPLLQYRQATTLPRIHDISTDTEDPPRFVDVLPLRAGAPNGVEWSATVAEQQRRGYPDLAPLKLDVSPAEALRAAEDAARRLGLDIVSVAPAERRLEATATTLMFGFKDDVVVRIRPDGAGSRVDVRSTSRVGLSDIGANAKRIRAFEDAVRGAVGGR